MATNKTNTNQPEQAESVHFPLEARVRRTLKFRGKVNGVLYTVTPDDLQRWNWFWERVDRETVCQFTGKKDKKGTEIYEADIVRGGSYWGNDDVVSYVEFNGNGFWAHAEDFGYEGEGLWDWDKIEVIGNIFENPELLRTNYK